MRSERRSPNTQPLTRMHDGNLCPGVNVTENPTRAIETFYVSPGVYNWSADASGVYFMLEAAAYGVPSITAFVNSAPAPLTSGGASCNGSFVNGESV